MSKRIVASVAIVVGGAEALTQLLIAFGVNISPDEHTAIGAAAGVVTALIGVWFHPDLPGGKDPA